MKVVSALAGSDDCVLYAGRSNGLSTLAKLCLAGFGRLHELASCKTLAISISRDKRRVHAGIDPSVIVKPRQGTPRIVRRVLAAFLACSKAGYRTDAFGLILARSHNSHRGRDPVRRVYNTRHSSYSAEGIETDNHCTATHPRDHHGDDELR